MKYFFLLAIAMVCLKSMDAKVWSLSNKELEMSFDDATCKLSVYDKRCGKIWRQEPCANPIKLATITADKNTIVATFNGKMKHSVRFSLISGGSVEITISSDSSNDMDGYAFPSAFKTPDKNYYLLSTDGGGFLLSVDDEDYPVGNGVTYFCGGGLSMAWMGVTDTAFKTGYMAILETPYDAALRTKRENGLITFEPVWLPSMGKFGYDRKVAYHFFDKGGYVAQSKKYREFIWSKNKVITLRENEKKTPALAKMIGAPHIYVWDNAREAAFAKELKKSGIEKGMFFWDANHTPYPEIGYDTILKQLGYAAGVYEIFSDLKARDTAFTQKDMHGPLRFELTSFPGKYNQLAARKSDGGIYFNQFGTTACPVAIRGEMNKRIDRELKEYPHEAYFLDVYQANGLFECYAPEHRLTRQQFAEAVIANYKTITNRYGQFMGGEWGADYLGSNSVFVHGMMTLQRTWFGSEIEKKGTIYWYGDWKSNPRPSQMLGSRTAPNAYLKYSINQYTRVPLYELVYHDAILTSWRWEDGNHHNPEIWWKKDLYNILYGSAPLWNLSRERWEEYRNTFIQSYNNVCPWLQKIGYDEMVGHRFLTNDHQLQETVFSSGKKAVVNFGDSDKIYDGKKVPSRSFITIE